MYFLASNLVGFKNSSLRVKFISNCSDGLHVNVVTSDLLDAGTKLTLKMSSLEQIEGEQC